MIKYIQSSKILFPSFVISVLLFSLSAFIFTPLPAIADHGGTHEEDDGSTSLPNPLAADSFEEFIDQLIDVLFVFATPIFALMIGISAFYFIIGGGNPKKRETAKKIFKYALIGFTIIALAQAIVAVVESLLPG